MYVEYIVSKRRARSVGKGLSLAEHRGGSPPYKGTACKVTFFLPFFVIKSPSGVRFCEIEKDFCEIEKDFLRIEKDFALSPPAMRVVRRAFEEGENRPCRLG